MTTRLAGDCCWGMELGGLKPGFALGQVFHQRSVKRDAGVERDVIHPGGEAFLAVVFSQGTHAVEVIPADAGSVDQHRFTSFRIAKIDHPVKRKIHFRFVHDVKQNHIMSGMPQHVQRVDDRSRIGQQIGKNHHQTAMPKHCGDPLQVF